MLDCRYRTLYISDSVFYGEMLYKPWYWMWSFFLLQGRVRVPQPMYVNVTLGIMESYADFRLGRYFSSILSLNFLVHNLCVLAQVSEEQVVNVLWF